ncbi:MAG TPA: polysaccharide biosynthesis C-terminal domain-containing protein [Coriobacteriia bacterium]
MSDPAPVEPLQGSTVPAAVRIRSSAWVFAAQIAKTALSIPVGIILARTLGAGGKGSVTVVQTTAAMTVALLNIGMPSAVMWLSARGKASGRGSLVLGAGFAAAAVALAGAITFVVGPQAVATRLGLSSGLLFLLAVAAIVPSMLNYFIDSYLLGRGAIRALSTIDVATLSCQLVGMAGLALTHRLTTVSALLLWLAINAAAMLWKAYLALRSDAGVRGATSGDIWRDGRTFALKSWLGNTVTMLSLRQDMLLLAMLAGTRTVGIYSISVTAAELAWYVPNALQSVATVKFAAENESTDLAARMNRSVWPFTLAFAVLVFLLVAPLIPLVYGGQFSASVLPLLFLLPGIVATSMSTSLSAWLTGRGHPQEPAMANVANMGVNLLANLALIPRFGAVGAALASTVSYTVATAVIVWRFRARTGARIVDVLVPRGSDLKTMLDIAKIAVRDRLGARDDATPVE